MKKTIYLLVLCLLLAGGAIAQMKSNKQSSVQNMVEKGEDSPIGLPMRLSFNGIETGAAELDVMNSSLYRGNSFAMVSGEDRGIATNITINYDFSPVEDQPGVFTITGGTWTLSVYEHGNYVGTLFGEVADGTFTDVIDEGSGDCVSRSIVARFRINGGMERYENVEPEDKPSGDFSSYTDYTDRKHTSASLSGIL
ncbi:MAG TPA: hypothetical protein VGO50_11795 [Pyrinomonadaceae bacterium]|jgi:hypothetical protein|nr:hypothetical protein [Pyrinomonadaceae bacterium]